MIDLGQRQTRDFAYTLADRETEQERTFPSFLSAREAGQEMAPAGWLGWRQEQLNTWFLLPERRFSVTVKALQ